MRAGIQQVVDILLDGAKIDRLAAGQIFHERGAEREYFHLALHAGHHGISMILLGNTFIRSIGLIESNVNCGSIGILFRICDKRKAADIAPAHIFTGLFLNCFGKNACGLLQLCGPVCGNIADAMLYIPAIRASHHRRIRRIAVCEIDAVVFLFLSALIIPDIGDAVTD